ncbi:MAG: ion transporter [Deltaproteobacteria bacterium]|jgi:voltage-gated sodium channel|nr:ion transporter [Deltaproteobacteria bacterium]
MIKSAKPVLSPGEENRNPKKNDGRGLGNALLEFCEIVYRPSVSKFILIVILANAAVLGLETSVTVRDGFGFFLRLLNHVCLVIFCVELVMKTIRERLRFFASPWNVFDFIVVGVSMLPGAGHLSVLRSLRILRAMRLITKLPKLRLIAESIIHALPSIGWITVLLVVIFYVFAVLTTTLFGGRYPDFFGDMGESMYTLFQLLTLDSWSSGVSRTVMREFPHAYLVFIPFVILSSFIVLNVFIGIIVNSIHEVSDRNNREEERAGEKAEGEDAFVAGGGRRRGGGLKAPDHPSILVFELDSLKSQLSRMEDRERRIEEMLRAKRP